RHVPERLDRRRVPEGRQAVVARLALQLREAALLRLVSAVELRHHLVDAAFVVWVFWIPRRLRLRVAIEEASHLARDALLLAGSALGLIDRPGIDSLDERPDAAVDDRLQHGRVIEDHAVVARLPPFPLEAAPGGGGAAVELRLRTVDALLGVRVSRFPGRLRRLVALEQALELRADALVFLPQTRALDRVGWLRCQSDREHTENDRSR